MPLIQVKKISFMMILFCAKVVFSQDRAIDSLKSLLSADKEDSGKVKHLFNIAKRYSNNGDIENSKKSDQEGIRIAKKIGFTKNMDGLYNNLAIDEWNLGNYNAAIENNLLALDIRKRRGDQKGISASFMNLGTSYWAQSKFSDALEYYFKALKINEDLNDKEQVSRIMNNIGIIYSNSGNYKKSLEYYLKALKIAEELGDQGSIASCYGNIGVVYYNQKKYAVGLDYFLKAVKLNEELNNKEFYGVWLGNIGSVYSDQGDSAIAAGNIKLAFEDKLPKSLVYYQKALKIAEESGNKNMVGQNLVNIGSDYISFRKYDKAFGYVYRALAISDSIGARNNVKEISAILSELYETSNIPLRDTVDGKLLSMDGMRLRSLYYYKKYISIKDSLFSEENNRQMVQKEMTFDFEKKQNEAKAEQDEKDILVEEEKLEQRIIIAGVSCGLLLVIILATVIFKNLKQNQQKNKIITEQKELVEKQKELVEEKQKEILDSILYARRIQTALITSEKYISKTLNKLNA